MNAVGNVFTHGDFDDFSYGFILGMHLTGTGSPESS